MKTITTMASSNTLILGIDLGKNKSVGCVHDPGKGEYGFTTFDTSRAEMRKLLGATQPAVSLIS